MHAASPTDPAVSAGLADAAAFRQRFRAEFEFDPDAVLLNSAGVAPLCRPARLAIEDTARRLGQGFFALEELMVEYNRARSLIAALCGAEPMHVAMMQTCAAAISQVALGMKMAEGDQILLWDQEYASNSYPWHVAARRVGATVHTLPSEPDYSLSMERMLEAISSGGEQVRAVAVSWVQYQTGAVVDLQALAQACRAVGAWLVVDAFQGLGVIPFDMRAVGVDAVCGGSHKWMCGPVGHGFLALHPSRVAELEPVLYGAMTYGTPDDNVEPMRAPRVDARRFEPGSPLLLSAIGTGAAVALLQDLGVQRIYETSLELADRLIAGLRERDAALLLPQLPAGAPRSPIVTFIPRSRRGLRAVIDSLWAQRVAFACRADGIRLSPHGFNDPTDVTRFFDALDVAAM